jgi:hypothetical protein
MYCNSIFLFITVHRMEGTINPVFNSEHEMNQFPQVSFMVILCVSQQDNNIRTAKSLTKHLFQSLIQMLS